MKELQALLSMLESSMAEIAESLSKLSEPDRAGGVEKMLEAIESGLADVSEAAKSRLDLAPIVDAIKAIKFTVNMPPQAAPVVNVNVPQQAPPVVSVNVPQPNVTVTVPESGKAKWKVHVTGGGLPPRTMTIERA